MINKKTINILICVIMIHGAAQAITETQARLGAVVFGACGLLAGSKTENPAIIFGLGAGVCVLGYGCLRQYTPAFRFATAKALLDGLNSNELAKGYMQMVIDIEDQITQPKIEEDTSLFETELNRRVIALYPINNDNNPYPLVTAINHLTQADNDIQKISSLLDSARPDLDPRKSAKREPLWQIYGDLNTRLQNYTNNVKQARTTISAMSLYSEQQDKYLKWQQNQQELKIKQQQADAASRKAQAAESSANAQEKQAGASTKIANIAWWKFWVWIFGARLK